MTGAPAGSAVCHPSISVVIPSHNHAGFLPEAVASALGQGTCVGEVVVVDDGSTDSTPAVVAAMTDPRIRSLRLGGEGPSAARNAGWRASRSDWVFFLDADDVMTNEEVFAMASAPEAKDRLKANTEEAAARGVFGAPTFFVGDEMFWGQDRVDFVARALLEQPR